MGWLNRNAVETHTSGQKYAKRPPLLKTDQRGGRSLTMKVIALTANDKVNIVPVGQEQLLNDIDDLCQLASLDRLNRLF